MSGPARIAMVCEGDAESYDKAFSGSAKSLLDHLRALGHSIVALNVRLSKPARGLVAARSFSLNRARWKAQFRRGAAGYWARTRLARRLFGEVAQTVDYVLQIGASFLPPGGGTVPCGVWCDWNAALSIRQKDQPESAVHNLSASALPAFNERERAVYKAVTDVFTFSDVLRKSFIEDYHLPPERVVTVHAGPNIDLGVIPPRNHARMPDHRPTVLFIGKEFRRKGGDVLLAAFRRVRAELPDARLLVIGTTDPQAAGDGVESLGLLQKSDPNQFRRLLDAYQTADVFCLPTRQDPFPTVVREAMFFSLPCVTTNIWALPEMVVDGETGFTVRPDDAEGLAAALLRILRNPALGRQFGEAGRRRAEQYFTWPATAGKMHERIQQAVKARRSRSTEPVGAAR